MGTAVAAGTAAIWMGPIVCGAATTVAPANGWMFQNWSQDLNGSQATQSLTISRKHTVTATVVQPTSFDLFLPVAIR